MYTGLSGSPRSENNGAHYKRRFEGPTLRAGLLDRRGEPPEQSRARLRPWVVPIVKQVAVVSVIAGIRLDPPHHCCAPGNRGRRHSQKLGQLVCLSIHEGINVVIAGFTGQLPRRLVCFDRSEDRICCPGFGGGRNHDPAGCRHGVTLRARAHMNNAATAAPSLSG